MERLDRISLFALASSMLLLVVAGWRIPAYPDALASVCRTRPAGNAATTPAAAPMPGPARASTTRPTP